MAFLVLIIVTYNSYFFHFSPTLSALLWRRAVGFAVALPHAPDLSQGTEWGVCVNNSKRHLTKRFMGRQNRYCPFYGPETGKQHYPDADRGAYDVRQAEEPGPCQQ